MIKTLKNILIKIGELDRRIIFLLVALSISIPMMFSDYFKFEIEPSQTSKDFFNTIDKLPPKSNILVTFEYGPSTAPEIQPMVNSFLKHAFYNDHTIYLLALWPDGKIMSSNAINDVQNINVLIQEDTLLIYSTSNILSDNSIISIDNISSQSFLDSTKDKIWKDKDEELWISNVSNDFKYIDKERKHELLSGQYDIGEIKCLPYLVQSSNDSTISKAKPTFKTKITVSKTVKFSDYFSINEYANYINLGYKPGGESVIKGITQNLTEKFAEDINNQKVDSELIMNAVKDNDGIIKISNFDLIASFSAGSVGTEEWILYASDPESVPIVSGVTSVQVTDLIPYVRSKQLDAILDGLPAAAEYEFLVDKKFRDNNIHLMDYGKGEGQKTMIPQSIVHILIVLFIIFGNVAYFLRKKEDK